MTDPDMDEFHAQLTADADAFEAAWTKRSDELERSRNRRSKRTNRQFWFLFVFLFASFILLAYRTESTAQDLREGLYGACQARVSQTEAYNQGREALINLVVNNPERPVPPEKVPVVVQQLRDGLLLPVEDCGPNPDE